MALLSEGHLSDCQLQQEQAPLTACPTPKAHLLAPLSPPGKLPRLDMEEPLLLRLPALRGDCRTPASPSPVGLGQVGGLWRRFSVILLLRIKPLFLTRPVATSSNLFP